MTAGAATTAIGRAKKGDWVRLGTLGRDPISWAWVKKIDSATVLLLARQVLAFKAFDTASDEHEFGDNRWRDATLRHWLNSTASAGQVDFGPHPPPSTGAIAPVQVVPAAGEDWTRRPDPAHAYERDPGFLHGWAAHESACLAEIGVSTEVLSSYGCRRKRGKDGTRDRVFVCTFEEWGKIPSAWKAAPPAPSVAGDPAVVFNQPPSHWSRSPLEGLGVSVLDLPYESWRQKAKSNSGAYVAMGVRPCVAVRASARCVGSGTEADPYRVLLAE